MKGYSWSRSDFIDLLANKYYNMDFENYNGCLTLPEEYASETDFKAEATIDLDWNVELPKSFSLGEWVYRTNYQGSLGACTSCSTSHGVQVLNVKAKGVKPVNENLITPSWRDLWKKMGHSTSEYDGGDYVEKAVSTAYKSGITNEEGGVSKIDGYAYGNRTETDKGIETIKRYIYNGQPVVWVMRGNKTTWIELTNGHLKTYIKPEDRTGGHAICCVGWDEGGLRFLNSRNTNDGKGLKSRFYVEYKFLKNAGGMFNRRYRVPFLKAQANNDPQYIKRKNIAVAVLKGLKVIYKEETPQMQRQIESLSLALRNHYPEINDELPVNS